MKLSYAGKVVRLKTKIATRMQNFILNHLGSLAPKLVSMIGAYPYVIKLDVVEDCNLACKMCYASKSRATPLEKILAFLDQLKNVPLRLDLLGGEPLMRDDLSEIVGHAKGRAKIREVTLYTNGTLASEDVVSKLHAAGLDNAIVSLISHDREIHDNFVGNVGAWQRTLVGIKNLVKAGIKTYTFTALHSENIGNIEQIYKFATALGVKPLFYQYIPQKIDDSLLPSAKEWHQCKHKVLYQYSPDHASYFKRIISCCHSVCLGGKYALSIKLNGDITPCPFIHDLVLGNVYQSNLWDIFARRHDSKLFQEFTALPQNCKACSHKHLCGGGCRAGNKLLFGSYLTKDCRCLGPYHGQVVADKIADCMPTFF